MGLSFGWRDPRWISALPPILLMAIFKIYISRAFGTPSRYYSPTQAELSSAQTHSARQDGKNGRLSRRFGHPALHAELYTPMLHANMIPLLSQVFEGKLGNAKFKMSEMGGKKMDTTVIQGGIKIAGIAEVRFVGLNTWPCGILTCYFAAECARIRPNPIPARPRRSRLGRALHRTHPCLQ